MEKIQKESKDDLKLRPYDRLQSIFSEKDAGKLTETASEKLDFILGTKPKFTSRFLLSKIIGFFRKIDGLVFKPRVNKFNNTFSKRRNEKSKRFH